MNSIKINPFFVEKISEISCDILDDESMACGETYYKEREKKNNVREYAPSNMKNMEELLMELWGGTEYQKLVKDIVINAWEARDTIRNDKTTGEFVIPDYVYSF